MPFDHQAFIVHDVSGFPIIRSRPEAIVPGYAGRWMSEMEALLAQGQPFVVVFPAGHAEEAHEDRKRRGIWLKANKQALGRLCLSLIAIEPDRLKRVALRAQTAMATKAFGIAMEIAASSEEATALAARLIVTGRGTA
ncbi:hypothetical protein BA190_16070 [Labrys sp. WJW]|uniref:hypothetical protein n=1 Tax=Labrys sp. WJW TaxID=1737983 RepID=UPI000836B334|nr:hypothetical protein [Labrys sp. WJW]OCC04002.1 hypothetical protein BA190_16070 [Labrys sp. WJW]